MQQTRQTIDISWWAVIKVFAVVLVIQFLFQVRDILALLFLVFIFVAALHPIVQKMQRKMPRIVAVTLVYLALFVIIIGASTIMFQPLANQASNLASIIPDKVNSVLPLFSDINNGSELLASVTEGLQQFSGALANFSGNIVNTTFGIFGGIFTAFTVLVLTFYLLLEEKAARHFLDNVLATKNRVQAMRILDKIALKMGSWVRGQLMLMVIIGVIDYIVLVILGVESPLPLAVWGGLMEVVPYLGPILGALPAVVVALVAGTPLQALLVAVLLIVVVQQLEGQFLVPKIMQKAVGLSPVIVILALLIGGKVFGIIGALLAVPVAATIAVLVQEWPNVQKTFNS